MENSDLLLKINELEEKIEKYNRAYYDENKSLISDYEYDLLKKELEKLRNNLNAQKTVSIGLFGSLETPIEQKIGYRSNNKFAKITHKKRMESLANALTLEEFYDFVDRTNRFLKTTKFPQSICELKFDGLSFSAMYSFGKLKYVATRGDGIVGEDVTNNVLQIDNFPTTLPEQSKASKLEEFEVRGEIYMPKDAFEKLNETLNENEKFSNPRNAASGTLRQLNPNIVKQRGLKYYSYYVGECSEKLVHSQTESLQLLQQLGFAINEHWKMVDNIEEIIKFHKDIAKIRYELDCDIDGVVIKINDFKIQELLGSNAHDPRWAIAFKFSGLTAITKLVGITNQIGRTGILTPVAELIPVNIGGVIVKRATLHNYDEINRLGLSIGDLILIKRSGDVIPKIIKVEKHFPDSQTIIVPKTCPCCNTELQKNDEFVAIYCPNHKNCKSQIIDGIRHFASRNGFDIVGLGRQTINIFYDLGFLKNILDIFELKKYKVQIANIDGFGEKSANNILTAIEESKNIYFNKLLYALGIDEIGENIAKILSRYYANFDELLLDKEQFTKIQNINGIGEQIIDSLIKYFNNPQNLEIIFKLNNILTIKKFEKLTNQKDLNGKSVVFTGKLQSMTRQQAKIQAEQLGYKVLTEISKATSYLVYGEKSGSKLKKAQELNINTISEDDWIKLVNEK